MVTLDKGLFAGNGAFAIRSNKWELVTQVEILIRCATGNSFVTTCYELGCRSCGNGQGLNELLPVGIKTLNIQSN